jgi:hypothetical protein
MTSPPETFPISPTTFLASLPHKYLFSNPTVGEADLREVSHLCVWPPCKQALHFTWIKIYDGFYLMCTCYLFSTGITDGLETAAYGEGLALPEFRAESGRVPFSHLCLQ